MPVGSTQPRNKTAKHMLPSQASPLAALDTIFTLVAESLCGTKADHNVVLDQRTRILTKRAPEMPALEVHEARKVLAEPNSEQGVRR